MDNQPDFERRFGGVARLYGAEGARRIAAAHVCVIGIGGVGSWAAEALARSAVGRITLIDLDHVAESNINRQIQADDTTLGQAKVLAMRERIVRINPQCIVACIEEFIDAENVAALLPACTAVIDAIDQVRAKAALAAHCKRHRISLIMTGGAGGRIDPTRICIDDLSRTTQDALASKVRSRLRSEFGFSRDPKKKFGIDCVYSPEQIRRPASESCDVDGASMQQGMNTAPGSAQSAEPPPEGGKENLGQPGVFLASGLNCAGYGSSVAVTAAFGMAAAARVLTLLAVA